MFNLINTAKNIIHNYIDEISKYGYNNSSKYNDIYDSLDHLRYSYNGEIKNSPNPSGSLYFADGNNVIWPSLDIPNNVLVIVDSLIRLSTDYLIINNEFESRYTNFINKKNKLSDIFIKIYESSKMSDGYYKSLLYQLILFENQNNIPNYVEKPKLYGLPFSEINKICQYCNRKNNPTNYTCSGCGASL